MSHRVPSTRTSLSSFRLSLALGLGLAALPLLASHVLAQGAGSEGSTKGITDADTAGGGRQQTLKQIADQLTQATGVPVFVDSALGRQTVTPPTTAMTREALEEYLNHLTSRLANGSVWFKIYLPPSPDGRRYSPDAVAQFARAQVALFGRPAPDTVVIQGKLLSMAQAAPLIQTLGLQPVYILTSKQAMIGPGAFPNGFAFGAGGDKGSALMDALTKQLGVSKVSDIPTGNYKVQMPGPDGTMQEANVQVENGDGKMRISVRMGDGGGAGIDVKRQ